MKHIEASKRIVTTGLIDPAAVKYSLVQRLRSAFNIETVGEGVESFSISAASKAVSYNFVLNVSLKSEPSRIRVLMDGQNHISIGTKIFYVFSLLAIMVQSLFSETIDPSHYNNMAMNAMFFLVIGGFIIYDHSRKIDEPEVLLARILDSLEAEFG